MWILIIALFALAVLAALMGWIRNRKLQQKVERGEIEQLPEVNPVDMECCGQHEVCEKESLLAAVSKKIEYYDDEELEHRHSARWLYGRAGRRIPQRVLHHA